MSVDGKIAAAGGGGARTLIGDGNAVQLWRTTDGGQTWVEQWPRLPTP